MSLKQLIESNKIKIFDGGMGTELVRLGAIGQGRDANNNSPEIVKQIHKAYLNAHVDFITANTFTLNPLYDSTHGGTGEVKDEIINAVSLAKQAVEGRAYILGDMCSTGQMLEPYGLFKPEQIEQNYYECALAHIAAGVDGIIIETFFDLAEMECAIRGVRKADKLLPIYASMTYSTVKNGGRTIMGNSAEDCAKGMAEAGADVIGINCGELTPEECAQIVRIYKESVDVPVLVQPNAGLPEMVGENVVYSMSPETFAIGCLKCVEEGAQFIGGCCGTTPQHIETFFEKISI